MHRPMRCLSNLTATVAGLSSAAWWLCEGSTVALSENEGVLVTMVFDQMLEDLYARQAISNALATYAHGIDRLDEAAVRSAFHPDAVDNHGPFVGSPDEFIAWVFPFLRDQYVTTSHHLTTQLINLQGTHAVSVTYALVIQDKLADSGRRLQYIAHARYVDRFECRDGEWKIAARTVVLDSARTDQAASWDGATPSETITTGARDRSDPFYRLAD